MLALAGETYMQVHDFNKASAYLEKAAALSPKAAGLRTSLGLSRLAQGDSTPSAAGRGRGASCSSMGSMVMAGAGARGRGNGRIVSLNA